jgi:chromate transporter
MNKLLNLFISTLKISAFTFGGGFVIVPLMRKRFVEELGWIDEQEMLDLTAIAQSSPGAIAVNASILVGYKVAGFGGALLTVLGTIIPPFVIIGVISLFYKAFRDNVIVSVALGGMLASVAAVLCDVVITMASSIFKKKALPIIMMVLSFVAVRYLKINILLVILFCAAIGVLDALYENRRTKHDLS